MSRTKAAAIVGLAAALLLGYVAWDRYLSPEARVRRALSAAAAAAEAADVETFLSFFSSEYADFMNPHRAAFEATVRESFGRVDRMNVTLDPIEIEAAGTEARATFDAVVVAIRGEERYVVLGTPFEPERLKAHLRREDGGWKIHRVELPSQ
ncbi:MAG TPA: nuclear transport factor 2 family protein [Vicinamibacteria bacterium]|nr:nuclear transport factor 2 family protein [Vicinamibacteria bacterium]